MMTTLVKIQLNKRREYDDSLGENLVNKNVENMMTTLVKIQLNKRREYDDNPGKNLVKQTQRI